MDGKSLYRKAFPFLKQKKGSLSVFPGKKNKYGQVELIGSSREDVRTNLTLSFLRLTKSADYGDRSSKNLIPTHFRIKKSATLRFV